MPDLVTTLHGRLKHRQSSVGRPIFSPSNSLKSQAGEARECRSRDRRDLRLWTAAPCQDDAPGLPPKPEPDEAGWILSKPRPARPPLWRIVFRLGWNDR
jgi:hypothetical protein